MVLEEGGRLSAICIEYVCILHIKGPVALEQASFGRKAEGGATPDGKWEEEDMSPNVVFCGTAVISKQGK